MDHSLLDTYTSPGFVGAHEWCPSNRPEPRASVVTFSKTRFSRVQTLQFFWWILTLTGHPVAIANNSGPQTARDNVVWPHRPVSFHGNPFVVWFRHISCGPVVFTRKYVNTWSSAETWDFVHTYYLTWRVKDDVLSDFRRISIQIV